MRKKRNIWIFPFILMGMLLMLTTSCKKDDDSNNNSNPTGQIPVLATTAVSNITQTAASCGGNITSDGGSTVTDRGVCWSTNQTPTIADSKTTDGTGAGSFVSSINGLTANTTYFVRAYATNSNGTGYGSAMSFTTQQGSSGSSFTDSRDGNVYQTVTIGNQVWMAENLKYLPSVVGPGTGSKYNPIYYVYDYTGTNVTDAKATSKYSTYGVLYNWTAAYTSCPAGWHLPSDAEWTKLTDYLGSDAGGKLKETGTTHWNSPNTGATNETGFTARPGGYRNLNGTFDDIGGSGRWWSATELSASSSYAWRRRMDYDYSGVYWVSIEKRNGFSVRCVRD